MATMQKLTASSLSTANSYGACTVGSVIPDKFPVGLRVLVVDDDPACLKILEHMLRKCLYQGMGDGVSKTSIKYLDPYKKALQKEQKSQVVLQAQVENLERRLLEVESRDLRREMEGMFASLSQANTQMRPSTERGSSSQGSQSSQSVAAHLDQTTPHTRGPSLCKLQHITKKNIIAYGRLKGTESPEAGFYRIVLDEIVDGNVDLFDGERKLVDVILGDVLDWPIIRIILY